MPKSLDSLAAAVLGLSLPLLATLAVRADLPGYVGAEDESYGWVLESNDTSPEGSLSRLTLTSQSWRGKPWVHGLRVYEPAVQDYPETVLLYITGGSTENLARMDGHAEAMALARLIGARVAVLPQVPNQPLLGGKFEDDLIAETFVRYIETGEEDWPLLQPMVKSAVAAMDAVQEFAEQRGKPVENFVVIGASKRGWTTWLTAAVDDRVAGIAPMVIPTLNMKPQSDHQLATWGRYSEQINDYVRRNLLQQFDTPRGLALWKRIDPYSYLDRITVPSLQINGTNDPYWTLDSMNLFWDDIQGDKYVVYLPNAGHGLDQNRDYALQGITALFRHVASGRALPSLSWEHADGEDGRLSLTVVADPAPKAARLWHARSETKDFRKARWESDEVEPDTRMTMLVPRPPSGSLALFGDLTFEVDGIEYHLSTQVRQVDPQPAE